MRNRAKPDRFTEELVSDLAAAEHRSFPMMSPANKPRILSLERRVERLELLRELDGLRGARLGWARTGPEQDLLREEYEEKMDRAREIRARLAELEAGR